MLNFTNYPNIPSNTRAALSAYVERGYMPGGFLESVLANDLFGAIGQADRANKAALADIVMFIYNEVPANAWGSRPKVQGYVAKMFVDTAND